MRRVPVVPLIVLSKDIASHDVMRSFGRVNGPESCGESGVWKQELPLNQNQQIYSELGHISLAVHIDMTQFCFFTSRLFFCW